MVLRCECGGPVRVQDGTDPENAEESFWELYECQTCGRTGTLHAESNPHRQTLTGCLVAVQERGRL